MLSTYLHVLPMTMCYFIRWKDYFGFSNPLLFVDSPKLSTDVGISMVKSASLYYIGWVAIYTLIMHIILYNVVNEQKWRSSFKDQKYLHKHSELTQRIFYHGEHAIAFYFGVLVSMINYSSIVFNTIFVMSFYVYIFWNGAVYYMDHFSKKYQKKIEDESFQKVKNRLKQIRAQQTTKK